jgi:anaerobic dimethyl sulfoxide reductase subunit B (iron-sulfur subunit)
MCIDRLKDGKKPICVLSCSMRALEFGPLEKLVSKFGDIRQLEEMPSGRLTIPSAVFRPAQHKRKIVPWDPEAALKLWKSRGPYAPEQAPDLFTRKEDVTDVHPNSIGRDRLVLKAQTVEELMYFTTDND